MQFIACNMQTIKIKLLVIKITITIRLVPTKTCAAVVSMRWVLSGSGLWMREI